MAAEAIASVVLGRLASVTLNKLEEHFQLAMGDQNEVKQLTHSFQAIQALLYDAEMKKITNATANVGVTLWLQRFRDVAYKMDDIIDQWITETLISEEIGHRHEVGVEINDLRKELDDIIIDKDKLSLKSYPAGERLPTSSIVDESEIFGRDQDKKMISNMLLDANTPTNNPFIIISIIGMGGLGKTTLAQLVYNQDSMKSYFQHNVIWVSVSDYFHQTRIAKEIIRGAGVRVPEYLSAWNNELHKLLCDSVKKKKFLLVLDDMWTDDDTKWEPFKLALKNAAPGSRILVTTRKQSVADMIGSNYSHLLEDNCWQLLSRLAFDGKNADKKRNEAWINIGKAIAKRCKGVPLSAKVLGNLLRVKQDISEWQTVMDNKSIWELEDGILKPALLLSYYDLPPAVRACFVYCSIFPKGHTILKDELIGLWMAQGLIVSTEGEAVGREYFNSLAARSFFQNFMLDLDGNIISCDMHDLVHDFAQFLTQGEYLTSSDTSSSSNIQQFPRHLSFFYSEEFSVNPDSLRSFISHGDKNLTSCIVVNRPMSCCSIIRMRTILPDLLHHLRYLRVLVIRSSDLEFLPSEIEKLIHLRYLDLSENFHLTGLPDSLCNLYNLQTLNVSHCSELRKLPDELGRMINLRHLRFENKWSGIGCCLPQGIGNLVSLHTLTEFRIRVGEGFSIKLVKNLNQLEGHLSISGLDLVQNSEDAYVAMLKNKKKLQSLLLNFSVTKIESEDSDDKDFEIASSVETVKDVLAALEPPSLLGKLKIMNYRGSNFSSWIEMLSNLHNLELDHCNCVELPALGKLPSLEHLSILDMHQLKRIGPEFYDGCHGHWVAFPQLKTLRISKAHCLVDFTLSSGGFPLLHQVELDDCIGLTALPAFGKLPSLECLNISGLHNVKHIGTEFYGDGGEFYGHCVAFPQLKTLRISKAHGLVDFVLITSGGFPLLDQVDLDGCHKLKALPAFGKLPSLECLKISDLHNVKHIGKEFYGDGGGYADSVTFPKLVTLVIREAYMLEEWDAFVTLGMPFLREVCLHGCHELKALPAFGKLPSLECLNISGLHNVKHIGTEFYGDGGDSVPFPKLEKLAIGVGRLEELDVPGMPFLRELVFIGCHKLKALPALGKLPSLEYLYISDVPNVKHIGAEFYGDGGDSVPFPKLKQLEIDGAPNLEEWDLFSPQGFDVMPCLGKLEIYDCGLKALPALGKLGSLKELRIKNLKNLKHIGSEFYGKANRVAFPELKTLAIKRADSLEEWGFGADDQITIMPCLREVYIERCGALKKLPALGKLQSLETLTLFDMASMKEIGNEFYGGGGGGNFVSFPNLLSLFISGMNLELWALGTDDAEEEVIMPRVREIHISDLKLKTLPALGKLPCLESLELMHLDNVEHIGPEFYGLRTTTEEEAVVVFPKLHELSLSYMRNLQRWEPGSTSMCSSIMPCLRDLTIYCCSLLKSLPQHLSTTLVSLSWHDDSNLKTPPELGQLKALQELKIQDCSWVYMPRMVLAMVGR